MAKQIFFLNILFKNNIMILTISATIIFFLINGMEKDEDLIESEEPFTEEVIDDSSRSKNERARQTYRFFDSEKTDSLSSVNYLKGIRGMDEEFDEYLNALQMYKELTKHKKEHPFGDITQIRREMDTINQKIRILKQLRSELDPNSQAGKLSPNRIRPSSIQRITSKHIVQKSGKLNFKRIGRKTKKTAEETPQQKIVYLQDLLAKEDAHLKSQTRIKISYLIYSLASYIPTYSEILDQKIKKTGNKIASKEEHKKEQEFNKRKVTLKKLNSSSNNW